MKKISTAILTTAALAFALPAAAQSMSNGYIGGSIGQSKFNIDCGGLTCDDKDTAFKIFGGYSFNQNIAVEVGWQDLGKSTISGPGGSDELKASAFDLTGVFSWPFSASGFWVFGRAGFYYGKVELSGLDTGSKTSTNLTYGLGGGYDFNKNLGLRLEWQRYSKMKARNDATGVEDDGDVDALSIGVLYRFQ
jgi:OOP family OmpA-OmpF porin